MIIFIDEPEAAEIVQKSLETQQALTPAIPATRKNERQRKYVERNKEVVYAKNKPYKEKYNKTEKARQTRAAWRELNREKLREYHREYAKRRVK